MSPIPTILLANLEETLDGGGVEGYFIGCLRSLRARPGTDLGPYPQTR